MFVVEELLMISSCSVLFVCECLFVVLGRCSVVVCMWVFC